MNAMNLAFRPPEMGWIYEWLLNGSEEDNVLATMKEQEQNQDAIGSANVKIHSLLDENSRPLSWFVAQPAAHNINSTLIWYAMGYT